MMIGKKLLLLLFALSLMGAFWLDVKKDDPPIKTELKDSTHPLVFFDKDTFYSGIAQSKRENRSFTNHISGGVIPHHLYPGFIITDFFSRLAKQNPKTIILIGPNHYERDNYIALSSMYGWETPFGVVWPDEHIVNELVETGVMKIDETVVPKDHAVAGIMPFVKYYLPETKNVPILQKRFMT